LALLTDLIQPTTRMYAKSEWAPAGPLWPALSFSQRGVANRFGGIYTQGNDFVITVGTANSKDTQDPAHRQRLLSLVDVAPNIIVNTAELVHPEAWERAQQSHPDRWKLSMPIVRCWAFTDFPDARTSMAATYKKFANPTTRGRPIPVDDTDRTILLGLRLTPVDIPPYIEGRLHRIPDDVLLNRDFTRIIQSILGSVARTGTERGGLYPERHSLNFSDLFRLFQDIWRRQKGNCNLCNAPIVPGEDNPLLKMSADRIDSAKKVYDTANVHLTHLGCNLAKSSASIEEWQDFLDVLRGSDHQDAP
jgi:hypothetical protein